MKHSTEDLHVSMQTILVPILFLVEKFKNANYVEIYRHKSLADQQDARDAPPLNPNFIIFMQFLAKMMPNYKLVPPPPDWRIPPRLAHSHLKNPGYATANRNLVYRNSTSKIILSLRHALAPYMQ